VGGCILNSGSGDSIRFDPNVFSTAQTIHLNADLGQIYRSNDANHLGGDLPILGPNDAQGNPLVTLDGGNQTLYWGFPGFGADSRMSWFQFGDLSDFQSSVINVTISNLTCTNCRWYLFSASSAS
jgi:hypothetical protein